ncbi:hypothetical protein PP935_gp104 [Rhizobium phage RHph_N34]|uniref:Uncharacterized protein n=1 Tax=Rhizobium phage RHph_N34 TaxID=2509586 RepID=A0A7S5RIX6_9CAUD|nr:hypothetical protein PP935_gp104 [Rhizobium phage RHph_N34]QIG73879.1 hypothetical protein EVC06_104 [Rhizobium phage RHph_N34]
MADQITSFTKKWAARKLYRFLSQDFKHLSVYKAGLIDELGRLKVKVKDMTPSQLRLFSPFERLMLYVKRVLRQHGVSSLALAVTYLENDMCDSVDDELLDLLDRVEEDMTVAAQVAGVDIPVGGMVKRKKK